MMTSKDCLGLGFRVTYIVGQQKSPLKMGQFGQSHWENTMMHNYAHGLSMFDHLNPPTIILYKVKPSTHNK
jgi:hypothetical protein